MRKFLLLIAALAVLGCGRCAAGQGSKAEQTPKRSLPYVLSAEELFKKVSPSVFIVATFDASKHLVAQGSAVVIGDGLLETNYHVVRDGSTFQVRQGPKSWPAKLVATNPDHDIAELKVDKLNAPAVPLGYFDTLAVGEDVYAVGAPEGLELTLSQGLISSLRQTGGDRVIQTTAAISPGSSGGGLFDAAGQLVGITVAYLKQGQNLNFALPADWLSSVHSASDWAELGSKAYQKGKGLEKSKKLGFTESYEDATSDYQESVRIDPQSETAWRGLGDALLGQCFPAPPENRRHCVDARRAYEEALRLDQNDEEAWEGVGHADERLGNEPEEEDAFRSAVATSPRDIEAWGDLALTYFEAGKPDEALTALDTIRALIKPTDERWWKELGTGYAEVGKHHGKEDATRLFEQAVECEQHAIRLRPKDAEAWSDLGYVYVAMGDRAGAVGVYEKLKALDPEAASAFFNGYLSPNQ